MFFDGVVVETYVEFFETVVAKQPILRLLNPESIEFVVGVPETKIRLTPYVESIVVRFDGRRRRLARASRDARRLAQTPRKDQYFYIHGYRDTFEDAAFAVAELWHFGRRAGVPIGYTWPAGHPRLLRGYVYDRESSEFTVHHLKEAIRMVSKWPEVERTHIIAHSSGADVALSAVRELFIESWAKEISPRELYRIENLVLAAADVDTDVVDPRVVSAHIHAWVSQLVVCTSPNDEALDLAEFLNSSPRGRIGKFDASKLTEDEREILNRSDWEKTLSVINFSGTSDSFGHSYFRTNPAVSSDLILLLDGFKPGSRARPLEPLGFGFWQVPKDYPNTQARPPNAAPP